MAETKIEWADRVWNPIVGCRRVSEGCRHCYAERMAKRLRAMGKSAYQDVVDDKGHWTGRVNLLPDKLDEPLRWKKPSRVFVNSMSDLFHERLPDRPGWSDFITSLWLTMMRCPEHTFMILTKRPHIMEQEVKALIGAGMPVLPNAWLGTSVEDQDAADKRIPFLLDTPAAVRFLSLEPLLGPVDLEGPFGIQGPQNGDWSNPDTPDMWLDGIHWVIVGGESGKGARPMHPAWVRSIRYSCVSAGVPFFFKQWGEFLPLDQLNKMPPDKKEWVGSLHGGHQYGAPDESWPDLVRVGKKRAGR
ncbi:MAG TPA: phage Gp37/Gp68 family protein, partial [Bellilinea sp.]|nr:phage Gp37/Gp68 family protein [Bellilinea sp.]